MKVEVIKKIVNLILILLVLNGLFILINYHFHIIIFPFQLEYREGAMLLLASELSKGHLPYTLANQPYLSDVFGCMYSFVSQPFIKLFGANLFSLRLLTAVCILCSSVFFYLYQIRHSITKNNALMFSIFFYGANLFLCIPISRPDSLGFLFFILALNMPVLMRYTRLSLFFALFLSILAYLTKFYFILAFPILLLYIFLFVNKLRALKYFLMFLFSFMIIQILIHLIFDVYFIGTFATQLASSVFDVNHLFRQLSFYFFELLLIPTLILITSAIIFSLRKRQVLFKIIDRPIVFNKYFSFELSNTPFFSNKFKLDVNIYFFIVGLFLILLKLGGHTGQFGVYLIHFMSFSFLFIISKKFDDFQQFGFILKNILYLIIIYNILSILPIKSNNYETNASFKKVDALICNNSKVLSTPIFASILCKYNKPVYASGLTEYFWYVPEFKKNRNLPKPLAVLKDRFLLSKINQAEKRTTDYSKFIKLSVEKKYFNLILTDTSMFDDWLISNTILKENYKIVDSFNIHMYATYQSNLVYVFKPK